MLDLATCLKAASEELGVLAARAREVGEQVSAGRPLADVIGAEPRPLVIARLATLLDDVADAGAAARRAEAAQLQAEGLSQGQIAKIFGVTRQRVSALLAPPPPPGARDAKRPRPAAVS
jgi:DNA-directed RNA polymerase specialized sigma24 family protein